MSEKRLLHQSVRYDYNWLFDALDRRSEEVRARFLEQVHKRILHANSPLEVAQKVLQADSPLEAIQKAFQADTPLEVVQKLLQVDSPEEAALKFIQTEEQFNRFIELFQERKLALSCTARHTW